jgi:hypothetical protein
MRDKLDELRARIRVALRMSRSTETIQSRFTNGPLTIDFDALDRLILCRHDGLISLGVGIHSVLDVRTVH